MGKHGDKVETFVITRKHHSNSLEHKTTSSYLGLLLLNIYFVLENVILSGFLSGFFGARKSVSYFQNSFPIIKVQGDMTCFTLWQLSRARQQQKLFADKNLSNCNTFNSSCYIQQLFSTCQKLKMAKSSWDFISFHFKISLTSHFKIFYFQSISLRKKYLWHI